MAILKAATWPGRDGRRVLKWGSTSAKALASEFEFTGKLIIICNSFPNTPDGAAIRSRGFARKIDITQKDAQRLLLTAAKNQSWYPKPKLATEVAEFLVKHIDDATLPKVSFRTLKKGYRLAEIHPDSWRDLFSDILPTRNLAPKDLIYELSRGKLKIKDQARVFEEKTGLKVRSFYNYRKLARLSRTARA